MLKMTIVVLAGPLLGGAGLVAAGEGLVATVPGISATPSSYPAAAAQVPAGMLSLYERAAPACPGLSWALLAAVGTVESDNGTADLPGVRSGANGSGAEGPMQFEPGTFARYADPVPAGGLTPPTPYDPVDAVFAAARYMCSLGAVSDPLLALVAYNCGNTGTICQKASSGYASEVLGLAAGLLPSPAPTATAAVAFAESQLGVPYQWGGEAPGQAFDCSGLVQWAYGQAGLALPRTAQLQYDAGPAVPIGSPLVPGDLIFFGPGPAAVEHVGLYAGAGLMIDAPHTGADVREEPVPTLFVGVTRPAATSGARSVGVGG
jgi:cell wall-associated NlpC family hydrolase